MKPIYKFNNGNGATICHNCRVILKTGTPVNKYLCHDCYAEHSITRHFRTWGVSFNKHGVERKYTEHKYISELTDAHLNNIIIYFEDRAKVPAQYIYTELAYRQQFPNNKIPENRSIFIKKCISPIIRLFGRLKGRQTTNII